MKKSLLVLTILLVALLMTQTAAAANFKVTIEAMKFQPAELKVKKGDTITWINKDFFPHTVTAENKFFNSNSIAASKSWKYKAVKAGSYSYKCMFHPVMKGVLVVE